MSEEFKENIIYKTAEQIEIIRANGDILGRAHAAMAQIIRPGIKTIELDKIAYSFINDHQASPSFKNYNKFPYSVCISVNDAVVHGFPSNYELKEGDIVAVDCGVYKNGFHADSAYTYPIGVVSAKVKHLLDTTYKALQLAIAHCLEGQRLGDMGFAIQSFVEAEKLTVVREMVGHGIGQSLHESPNVPNYGKPGKGPLILNGMTIAIEPMINLGTRHVYLDKDKWTIRTKDGLPSAQYEHTVAIIKGKAEPLTTFKYIEEVLAN